MIEDNTDDMFMIKRSGGSSGVRVAAPLLPAKRFKAENDSDEEEEDEEDVRYNQEMFKKRKAEMESGNNHQLNLL